MSMAEPKLRRGFHTASVDFRRQRYPRKQTFQETARDVRDWSPIGLSWRQIGRRWEDALVPHEDVHNVRTFPRGSMARQASDPRADGGGALLEGRLGLEALRIQQRAQSLRLGLCVIAAVLVVACLIPVANARPRLGFRRRD
jgi:hypothetical protein